MRRLTQAAASLLTAVGGQRHPPQPATYAPPYTAAGVPPPRSSGGSSASGWARSSMGGSGAVVTSRGHGFVVYEDTLAATLPEPHSVTPLRLGPPALTTRQAPVGIMQPPTQASPTSHFAPATVMEVVAAGRERARQSKAQAQVQHAQQAQPPKYTAPSALAWDMEQAAPPKPLSASPSAAPSPAVFTTPLGSASSASASASVPSSRDASIGQWQKCDHFRQKGNLFSCFGSIETGPKAPLDLYSIISPGAGMCREHLPVSLSLIIGTPIITLTFTNPAGGEQQAYCTALPLPPAAFLARSGKPPPHPSLNYPRSSSEPRKRPDIQVASDRTEPQDAPPLQPLLKLLNSGVMGRGGSTHESSGRGEESNKNKATHL